MTAPAPVRRPQDVAEELRTLAAKADRMAEDDGALERAFSNLALALVIHHRGVVALDNLRIAFALWETDGIAHAWARLHSEVDHAAMNLDWADQ